MENATQIKSSMISRLIDSKERAWLEYIAEGKSVGCQSVNGLRWAANAGHVERMMAMLEMGADIEAQDVAGITALTARAYAHQRSSVELLLDYGADVNKTGILQHNAVTKMFRNY